MKANWKATAFTLVLVATFASCRSAGTASGAPVAPQTGAASRVGAAPRPTDYVPADAQFVRGMIPHHRQALAMIELVEARTSNADIKRLALRTRISQEDEIALMLRWLAERGEPAPEPGGMHDLMPGMLSPEQMAELAAASGPEFDQLFLRDMIQHHQGALAMVARLFDAPGAGQGTELFQYATGVDTDQRIEIARMTRMLQALR